MSYEIDSKHYEYGAKNKIGKNTKKKAVEKEINTNVYNLTPEKPPAKSTYISHVKTLDKRISQAAKVILVYNNFDRLKICVDLRLYASEIEFENISLHENAIPDNEKSYIETQIERQRKMKEISSNHIGHITSKTNDKHDDNSLKEVTNSMCMGANDKSGNNREELTLLDNYNITEDEEVLPTRNGANIYPNCGIYRKNLPLGLNAIYIKNDYLIMDITGKWVADNGNLGLINIHNIVRCLEKVCECKYVSFNVAALIDVATVRVCDVTLDLITDKPTNYISAMSAMFPSISFHYDMYNYNNGGLIIRGKAKDTGMSFSMYHKGRELNDRRHNNYTYLKTIGEKALEQAQKTLRLEVHLWKLEDMKVMLELPPQEKYQVALSDVLKSTAPTVLNVMKKYKLTEDVLREEIKGFTDDYLRKPQTEEAVIELLAGIGAISLFKAQEYNIRATRDMIAHEFDIIDDEELLKKLNGLIRDCFFNFRYYNKPKCIKVILDLLDLIHTAYGRTSQDEILSAVA